MFFLNCQESRRNFSSILNKKFDHTGRSYPCVSFRYKAVTAAVYYWWSRSCVLYHKAQWIHVECLLRSGVIHLHVSNNSAEVCCIISERTLAKISKDYERKDKMRVLHHLDKSNFIFHETILNITAKQCYFVQSR